MTALKNSPTSRFTLVILPIIVCSAASLFYIYDYISRVMPSAMTRDLMLAFDLQAGGLGLLGSLYFYGYAPMQIPSGILFDRFGIRGLLSAAFLICAISVFIFGATHNYYIALFSRFITGATASFAFVGALVVGSNWFSKRYFAIYVGLVQLLGCAGAIAGQGPIAALSNKLGWHKAAMLIGLLGIVFAIINWLVIRDHPPHVEKTIIPPEEQGGTKFHEIFAISQNWWAALYAFFIWSPIVSFAVLWGIPFFQDVYKFDRVKASWLTSVIWIGVAIGGPVIGWISTHLHRRKIPILIAALIGLISMICLIYLGYLPIFLLVILLFFIGFASSSQATIFALVQDNNKKEILGTAIGFTNMAVIAGGVTVQPLIGMILQFLWQGKTENAVAIYSFHSFQIALLLLPVSFLAALIISLFFIKETYCKHQY